jgi:hypothetical protein
MMIAAICRCPQMSAAIGVGALQHIVALVAVTGFVTHQVARSSRAWRRSHINFHEGRQTALPSRMSTADCERPGGQTDVAQPNRSTSSASSTSSLNTVHQERFVMPSPEQHVYKLIPPQAF